MSAIDFVLFRERFLWKTLLDFVKRSKSCSKCCSDVQL